ncbi:hypothetical protein ATCC90586_001348 [Pythium insidiosum]|nr:hypothetical protein ATCC90586_001348 [Pythium insidiosum]
MRKSIVHPLPRRPASPSDDAPASFVWTLSTSQRVVLTALVLLTQGVHASYLALVGFVHWYVDRPDMEYYANLLVPPAHRRLRLWGAAFFAVAALHVVDTLYFARGFCARARRRDTRNNTISVRASRTSIGPSTGTIPRRSASTAKALLTSISRWILFVLGRRGLLGVESPHFEVVFLVRETVEIISQIVQLHNLSGLLSVAWINDVLVALVTLDCWSTPVLQHVYRRQPTLQRVLCVTCDILLTFSTCVVIPFLIFVPFALEFEYDTFTFSDETLYNDRLFANLVLQSRAVFALSAVDGFTKLVPHIGIFGGLRAVRGFLRPSLTARDSGKAERLNGSVDAVVAPSAPWLRALQSTFTSRRKLMHRARAVVIHCTHVVLVVLGCVIVGIHVHANTTYTLLNDGCQQRVHPWLVSDPSCSILEYSCLRERSVSPNETAFDGLNQQAVLILILAHCPALVVPPVLHLLPNLIGMEIYNSTLIDWSASASLDAAVHTRMAYFALVHSNLSALPDGLMPQPMPPLLLDIELIATNLTTLPAYLPQRWTSMSILYVECSLLSTVPDALMQMNLFDLSVAHNRIESIAALADMNSSPFRLSLAGNPLKNVTLELSDDVSIAFLSLLRTPVSAVPAWASQHVTDRAYLGDTPFCDKLRGDELSIATSGAPGADIPRECQIDRYLASVPSSSEQDVALLLHWNESALCRLAASASALLSDSGASSSPPASIAPPPSWLSTPVSADSLADDILELLARHAGGRWRRVCLAPNSPSQFLRVVECLCRDVETHPFVQHCLAVAFPGDCTDRSECFVLQLASVSDRESAAAAAPINSPVPTDPSARALFC